MSPIHCRPSPPSQTAPTLTQPCAAGTATAGFAAEHSQEHHCSPATDAHTKQQQQCDIDIRLRTRISAMLVQYADSKASQLLYSNVKSR